MSTSDRLRQALSDLGASTEEVRINLGRMGIKGFTRSAGDCPVARYLVSKGFADPSAAIACSVTVPRGEQAMFQRTSSPTPEPVRVFMRNFDDGEYPELTED